MSFDFGFHSALLVRRLPVMALFVLLFSGLGLITAFKLPETFSTSAQLLFESPQIPISMVGSAVQTGGAGQLDILEQRLMTRANLIDIANRFNVFEDIREMEPDNVVEAMRSATTIRGRTGTRNNDRATTMTISFEARQPQIVADVVNEFVTLVLQENSRFRVSRAENTLDFFSQEVDRLDGELSQRSVEIARFKSENAKALPQDQSYRQGRQTLLQERLDRLERELLATRQKFESLENSLNNAAALDIAPRSTYEEQMIVGSAELDRLTGIYGENNPRVIRLKDQIGRLKAIVAAEDSARDPVDTVAAQRNVLIETARVEAERTVDALQVQIDSTNAELVDLTQNIYESTSNAFKLAELERDYNIIQSRYSAAVSNLNSARMGERIEATAQGQRINVIENASVPQIPSGPDRVLIAAVGIFTGVGLAIGYFLLLEVLNRSIRRPYELLERFDIKPMATIPYMESRARRLIRRGALLSATLSILICVPLALWYIDTQYLPLELIVQKSLAKLGLD